LAWSSRPRRVTCLPVDVTSHFLTTDSPPPVLFFGLCFPQLHRFSCQFTTFFVFELSPRFFNFQSGFWEITLEKAAQAFLAVPPIFDSFFFPDGFSFESDALARFSKLSETFFFSISPPHPPMAGFSPSSLESLHFPSFIFLPWLPLFFNRGQSFPTQFLLPPFSFPLPGFTQGRWVSAPGTPVLRLQYRWSIPSHLLPDFFPARLWSRVPATFCLHLAFLPYLHPFLRVILNSHAPVHPVFPLRIARRKSF